MSGGRELRLEVGRGQSEEEEELGEPAGWRCGGDETDVERQGWMRCSTRSQWRSCRRGVVIRVFHWLEFMEGLFGERRVGGWEDGLTER